MVPHLSPTCASPIPWDGKSEVWVLLSAGWGWVCGCVGVLLWLGYPKVEHPINFGELLSVPPVGALCSLATSRATSRGLGWAVGL